MGKKGKAQGRAGQKKKAQKASSTTPRSSPWAQDFVRGKNSLLYDSEDDEIPRTLFKGFTGASPRTPSSLNPNIKLRHQTVAFVSAGTNSPAEHEPREEQLKSNEVEGDVVEEDVSDANIQTNIMSDITPPVKGMANMDIEEPQVGTQSLQPLFVVDTIGDESLAQATCSKAAKYKQERNPSRADSDSSVEVVFTGRGNQSNVTHKPTSRPTNDPLKEIAPTQPRPRHWATEIQEPVPNVWEPQANGWSNSENDQPGVSQGRQTFKWVPNSDVLVSQQSLVKQSDGPARAIEPSPATDLHPSPDPGPPTEVDALRADLYKRLREKQVAKTKSPEKGSGRRGKRGRKKVNRALRDANGQDSDDGMSEAAYDDYMANLAAQMDADEIQGITQTEFVDGPVMMVDGQEYGADEMLDPLSSNRTKPGDDATDDERWMLNDTVDSSDESDRRRIGLDFDDGSVEDSDSEVMGSSELDEALEYTEREQWEDEADLRQRRLEAKTDEQLAKLWAKQIELGIEGDELMIDDGDYDPEQFGDLSAARAGLDSIGFGARPNTKRKAKGSGFTFPNASALADTIDQYGEAGFDIMDFERPSLRPTKKGRKGRLPPEIEALSDDEEGFKDILADQWERDRRSKKIKKLEREELRAEGLLGSAGKKGQADLKVKYPYGMTLSQIKEEVHAFMFESTAEVRAFPPMAKTDRKLLHEVVSELGLKSKSVGSGKNRFPVLTKTRATSYDADDFERVFVAASRGLSRVMGNKGRFKKAAKKARGGAGGGFDKSAVSLRDGDIVGANAPEIGQSSMGHKLMEKMGWSKGTALGKDGEGRLLPVEQVIRSGKAGLG